MLLSKVRFSDASQITRKFQSLFFWMLLSKSDKLSYTLSTTYKFQSLFFWMLLSKSDQRPCGNRRLDGFNPYFSGCFSLSGTSMCPAVLIRAMFQSLFFWMLLSKTLRRASNVFSEIGFNPYFSGCFSLSHVLIPDAVVCVVTFQSLFFWMLLSKAGIPPCFLGKMEVSILIFLDASL